MRQEEEKIIYLYTITIMIKKIPKQHSSTEIFRENMIGSEAYHYQKEKPCR